MILIITDVYRTMLLPKNIVIAILTLLFLGHLYVVVVHAQNSFSNEMNQSTIKLGSGNNEDQNIVPAQIAAASAIAAAATTGAFTLINQRKLASLDIKKIKEDARTSYEFASKKRLYEECEPILFQLVEFSDYARYRILGLAREARKGRLRQDEGNMSSVHSYYLKTTIYRLLAPMVAFRLIQSQLTIVDLSLDSHVAIQYEIAKAIYHTFSADYNIFDLVKTDYPNFEYEPQIIDKHYTEVQKRQKSLTEPAKYKRQAILVGVLEKLVDDMIVYDEQTKKNRIVRYGEFEEKYFSKETTKWEDKNELQKIVRLLLNFQPRTHPIFWIILITQSVLYTSLKNIKSHEGPPYIAQLINLDKIKDYDWRQELHEATDDEVLYRPFKIAERYLQKYEENLYDKLINGI